MDAVRRDLRRRSRAELRQRHARERSVRSCAECGADSAAGRAGGNLFPAVGVVSSRKGAKAGAGRLITNDDQENIILVFKMSPLAGEIVDPFKLAIEFLSVCFANLPR